MGKGSGEHPPNKFMLDQYVVQALFICFMAGGVTLSSLSAGMDDGGTFPYQYFFTGFVLCPILLVNVISRWFVLQAVQKKGLTRKNILDVLNNTTFGNAVWPWSCRIGMAWCIPGTILTGIGGVNCDINDDGHGNTTARNNCYFDIEGEHGNMYKGLAIGLVVIHTLSFIILLLSGCPVHSVLDQIKEDPKPKTQTRPAASNTTTAQPKTTAAAAKTTAAAAKNTAAAAKISSSTTTTSLASTASGSSTSAASSVATNQAAAANKQRDIEMEALKKQLDQKASEIEKKEKELEEREKHLREMACMPAPPSYSTLMNESN